MNANSLALRAPRRPTPDEHFCSAWLRMNPGADFGIDEDEVHYLRMIALGMDDHLLSLVLLKKLKLASTVARSDWAPDLVRMNSGIEFEFGGGGRQFGRLVHPSVCRADVDLSIDSRLGAGLIGMRAGQELLWPDAVGRLRELRVIKVNNDRRPATPASGSVQLKRIK